MNTDINEGEQTAEAPASDSPQSESLDTSVDQQTTQQQESAETTDTNNEIDEVPKDNAAWAKMRTENKRLKEVVDTIDPSYLESLRGATAPQPVTTPYTTPVLPEDAEYNQVTQNVNWANQQVANTNRQVARLQQLELQQDREAERAYPELKTDKVFQQIVAEKKLAARVLGHDRTTMEIADEVSRLLGRREEQISAKVAQQTKNQILQRQVISSEPKGQTTGGQSGQGSEDLRLRVRRGDSGAATEVAKNLIADLEF